MKKVVVVLSLVFIGITVNAQTKYEKGMKKAFSLLEENKSNEAVNLFERISEAAPEEWLPSYYAAQINIMSGFAIKDKTKLSQQLEKAQAQLDHATSISPNNSEIMVLQAMLYTVWVAHDGATYGMMYGQKVAEIYAKAMAIDKDNPRVVLCKGEWDMGSARFFGKDTTPFCKEYDRALTLFEKYEPATAFHPSWGKDRAVYLIEECKK
ncbi:tetratricopeptide repeat protein [Kordia sp. YSTF-M3]|uniref:Tetratricopeptide repeat protein n=1 Tax=Kordia aestuariivivens TaxID=2759037 RepID=A0ABR7Q5P7_9FLAO|nr:tetratricopeptide repeat protein [Kordia aestuariivivens]MBC8753847.1 tetratricopeptide repeat protein [Kordia aestuariivivens]